MILNSLFNMIKTNNNIFELVNKKITNIILRVEQFSDNNTQYSINWYKKFTKSIQINNWKKKETCKNNLYLYIG